MPLAARRAMIAPFYAEPVARLQDDVAPFSFDEVEKILTDELGIRLSKAFERIEPVPIAAASIAQVHRAVLRGGREVALKIQRPGIREQVLDDLKALAAVAAFLDAHTEVGPRFGVKVL